MDHNLSFSWCWNSLLQFKDNFYFHFFAFYLPLGRYRNSLFRAGVRACVRAACVCDTCLIHFLKSDLRETFRIYWYGVSECPGNMFNFVRQRSRSQRSNLWSIFAFFTYFRELVLGFLLNDHQNWSECAQ